MYVRRTTQLHRVTVFIIRYHGKIVVATVMLRSTHCWPQQPIRRWQISWRHSHFLFVCVRWSWIYVSCSLHAVQTESPTTTSNYKLNNKIFRSEYDAWRSHALIVCCYCWCYSQCYCWCCYCCCCYWHGRQTAERSRLLLMYSGIWLGPRSAGHHERRNLQQARR